MTLQEYRTRFGVSYSHISRLCNVTQAAISLIANDKLKPSFDLAVKIEAATSGHVGRDIWYPPRPAPISITIGVSA